MESFTTKRTPSLHNYQESTPTWVSADTRFWNCPVYHPPLVISSSSISTYRTGPIFVSQELQTMILSKLYLTTQFSFKLNEKVLQVLTKVLLYPDFSNLEHYKRTSVAFLWAFLFPGTRCSVVKSSRSQENYLHHQKINVKTSIFHPLDMWESSFRKTSRICDQWEDFKQTTEKNPPQGLPCWPSFLVGPVVKTLLWHRVWSPVRQANQRPPTTIITRKPVCLSYFSQVPSGSIDQSYNMHDYNNQSQKNMY